MYKILLSSYHENSNRGIFKGFLMFFFLQNLSIFLYAVIWIRICILKNSDPDPKTQRIRIQYGSRSETLLKETISQLNTLRKIGKLLLKTLQKLHTVWCAHLQREILHQNVPNNEVLKNSKTKIKL